MAGRVVLDASFLLAWALQEYNGIAYDAVLENVMHNGAVVPGILPLEVTNVLYGLWRSGKLTEQQRRAIIADIRELPISVDARTVEKAWTSTADLAIKHGITTYDASYLELALREGGAFLTLDRVLLRAAGDEGVLLYPN